MTLDTESPEYIVSDIVLARRDDFTLEQIVTAVSPQLSDKFDTAKDLEDFVKERLVVLRDVGLITFTTFYYYVNGIRNLKRF